MNQTGIQIDPSHSIPYVDQWIGIWFIEPDRGHALYSAMQKLNIGMHLQEQARMADPASSVGNHRPQIRYRTEQDALAQNPDGQPVAIDWEQAPRSRGAYGYRIIDGVAVVELTGTLMKHEASATESTSTVMMRRTVRKMMADGQVKAVIFQIDSPGGTVAGIYELATDIAALAKVKPVHAHAANLCASAAYLLASQMRSISATPSSLIGSLGTFGVVYDFSRMCANDGIDVHLLKGRINGKEALMKGAGTPGTALSAEQKARLQEGVDDLNQQFYEAVIQGPRKPKASTVESWFLDAGVWVAAKAKQMGLVDRVESFDDLLARVSGEARNGTRDTTPSTTNKPAPDDGTSTGRRSDSHRIEITAGERSIVLTAPSVEAAMQLHAAMELSNQSTTNNNAGDTVASDEPTAEAAAGSVSPPDGAEAQQTGDDTPEKGSDMGQTNTTTAPTQSATEPKPATITELKAAFPKDPAFALEAAEQALTLTEAKAAYADKLMAENDQLREQVAKQNTTPPASTTAPGVKPVATKPAESQGSSAAGDAVANFNAAVEEQMAKPGFSGGRKGAVMVVAKRDPAGHRAYLEATNTKRKQRDMLADKYDG